MWRMHSGNRVLTDKEWELFSDGLDFLLFEVEEDIDNGRDETETGATAFDELTAEQKLAMLADVAEALRDPSVPMPRHTAANEATIAAVIASVRILLEMELEHARDPKSEDVTDLVRRHLLAVAEEHDWEDRPSPKETDLDAWEEVLDGFECLIFWDADYVLGDEFLDLPPEEARRHMEAAGIPQEYFLVTPDEPDEGGLNRARQKLARLFGRTVPDDGLFPGLIDNFTGIHVGPVAHDRAGEWEESPWVELIQQTDNGWDCPFAEWVTRYAVDIPREAFELLPAVSGSRYDVPDGIRVDPFGDQWTVRDERGWLWIEAVADAWAEEGLLDEETRPIEFETEADARAAYLQASRMYAEREARREAALARQKDSRKLPNSPPTPDIL